LSGKEAMLSHLVRLQLERLEDRLVFTGNIFVVDPIWISPALIREFAPDGTLARTIAPPPGDLRDLIVDSSGDIHLFHGTFTPNLATYDAASGTWSSRTTGMWSTVKNLTYGGIAAYQDYVYVTDM
jgi:hypothetical protein